MTFLNQGLISDKLINDATIFLRAWLLMYKRWRGILFVFMCEREIFMFVLPYTYLIECSSLRATLRFICGDVNRLPFIKLARWMKWKLNFLILKEGLWTCVCVCVCVWERGFRRVVNLCVLCVRERCWCGRIFHSFWLVSKTRQNNTC